MRVPAFRSTVLSLSALALAACGDVTAPTESALVPASSALAAAASKKPKLQPNKSARYSDKGAKPVIGSAGSSTLLVRALANKDGSADLEVTTGGSIDGAPAAPGTLTKVQVKAINTSTGKHLGTTNYNNVSGASFAQLFEASGVGITYQVQASIKGGAKGNGTDVVSVTAPVKRRPDLTVRSVNAPATALVNARVTVMATISELNGDVGATANCVLYANGVQVDRVVGQWVDAGSSVSCAFSTVFSSAGTKTLEVREESVVPADWDGTNNSASATITVRAAVVGPAEPLRGGVVAQQGDNYYKTASTTNYNCSSSDCQLSPTAPIGTYFERRNYDEFFQMYGFIPNATPITSAEMVLTSDGVALASSSLSPAFDGYSCHYANDERGFYASFCIYEDGVQYYYAGQNVTEATYFSLYYNAVYDAPSGQYSYMLTPDAIQYNNYGVRSATWGSELTIKASFSSATNRYVANMSIPLQPYSDAYEQPFGCVLSSTYLYSYCYGSSSQGSGKFGYVDQF